MNKEKTIKEKIEQSAVAAMGFSALFVILTLITAISNFVGISSAETVDNTAGCIYAGVDSVLMCGLSAVCVMLFKKMGFGGTPFSAAVVKHLSVVSVIFILDGIIPPAAKMIYLFFAAETVQFNSNRAALYIGIIMFFLTNIFRYGTMLQHEADDTV